MSYITIICDDTTQSVEDLKDHWRTLISVVDPIVEKNEESKDDQSKDKEPEDEDSTPDDIKPTIKKHLIFYTGVDKASKKLKRSTEVPVLLTLTPATFDAKSLPTIAWKILRFERMTTMTTRVIWSDEVGFCVLKAKADGTLAPGDLKKKLNPGYSAIFRNLDDQDDFDDVFKIPHEDNHIGVCNTTNKRQRFALCTIDPTKEEEDRFSPIIDLDPFTKSTPDIKLGFQCGPPVMLQAYDICGKRERTIVDTTQLKRPLFVNAALKPQAVDIRKLGQVTCFRLYSKDSGKNVLEKD